MKKLYPTAKIGLRKKVNPEKLKFAKELRKNPTKAEAELWKHIRASKLGAKFRRQSVIRGWIADFWCPKYGLVIELDGSFHDNRKEYDSFRDAIITGLGITILRFTNEEVFNDLECVLKHIKAHMK
jgi:very-short-patch-repair endonuclease